MNSSLFGYSLFSFLYQELHMCIHPNRENEQNLHGPRIILLCVIKLSGFPCTGVNLISFVENSIEVTNDWW